MITNCIEFNNHFFLLFVYPEERAFPSLLVTLPLGGLVTSCVYGFHVLGVKDIFVEGILMICP